VGNAMMTLPLWSVCIGGGLVWALGIAVGIGLGRRARAPAIAFVHALLTAFVIVNVLTSALGAILLNWRGTVSPPGLTLVVAFSLPPGVMAGIGAASACARRRQQLWAGGGKGPVLLSPDLEQTARARFNPAGLKKSNWSSAWPCRGRETRDALQTVAEGLRFIGEFGMLPPAPDDREVTLK